jgi:hypothetical protein
LPDLDGLANKTTVTLVFLWSRWVVTEANPARVLRPACDAYAKALGKKLSDIDCTVEGLRSDNSAAAQKALIAALQEVKPGFVYFAGIEAKAAPESFKYVSDPGDPKSVANETKENHTSWSAGVAGGVVLPWNMTLSGIVSRQVAYRAGKPGQICSPVGTQGLSTCEDHVLAAPGDPDRSNLVSFEVKQFFGANFAVAPRFSFDITKSVKAISVPIYILRDTAGGLNGGIAIGWRSDTKAVTASAFVGDILTLITRGSS